MNKGELMQLFKGVSSTLDNLMRQHEELINQAPEEQQKELKKHIESFKKTTSKMDSFKTPEEVHNYVDNILKNDKSN